jgi:hypothetical protein
MNWKPVQEAANVISAALIVWAFFRRSSTAGSAKVLSDGRVGFPPDRFAYRELPLVVVSTAFATMEALHHRIHSTDQLFFSAAIGFAVLAQLFSFPGTIVVTREGLEQIYWLRPEKRIRRCEIAEIKTSKSRGAVVITSGDGTKIVHSFHLVDRRLLLQELKEHCGSELPPDFPREPIPGL